MNKRFTLLSIAIFPCFIAVAQTGKISGVVQDGSSKTVSSATVSLLRAKDSSVVKFAPTNKSVRDFLFYSFGKATDVNNAGAGQKPRGCNSYGQEALH
jgi:hypothetical protein